MEPKLEDVVESFFNRYLIVAAMMNTEDPEQPDMTELDVAMALDQSSSARDYLVIALQGYILAACSNAYVRKTIANNEVIEDIKEQVNSLLIGYIEAHQG